MDDRSAIVATPGASLRTVRENQTATDAGRLKADHTVDQSIIDLHREMLRLPMDERRRRWKEYIFRLMELAPPGPP